MPESMRHGALYAERFAKQLMVLSNRLKAV